MAGATPRCLNCRQQVTDEPSKDTVMATQQQFPLDPNTALAPISMRNGGRKRHAGELLHVQSVAMQREQLRSYAHMEARSWQVIDGKERPVFLDVKWREAKESIETRCRSLREAAAAGHTLNGEAKALADHIALFRESIRYAMQSHLLTLRAPAAAACHVCMRVSSVTFEL